MTVIHQLPNPTSNLSNIIRIKTKTKTKSAIPQNTSKTLMILQGQWPIETNWRSLSKNLVYVLEPIHCTFVSFGGSSPEVPLPLNPVSYIWGPHSYGAGQHSYGALLRFLRHCALINAMYVIVKPVFIKKTKHIKTHRKTQK